MSFSPIKDSDFESAMLNTVEPFLEKIRKTGGFNSFDGKNIHYEYYVTPEAKANIAICHGFTESAEKFREVYYYFINAGYNVFAVDHRGHGNSYRIPGAPNTVKIGKFTDYVEDFNELVKQVIIPNGSGLPLYMYSHSMGGAIAIRYIETYPDTFAKVVLSAPMVCANTGMPENVATAVGKITKAIGLGNASVPGRCTFDPQSTYVNSNDTSKERFNYYMAKKVKNPVYRTCGPSFNWVNEAMKNTWYIIKDENIAKIKCEVLLCQPETDKMVLPQYQDEFIAKVKNGKKAYFENCKHEIYNSTYDVLEKYYPVLFDFYG